MYREEPVKTQEHEAERQEDRGQEWMRRTEIQSEAEEPGRQLGSFLLLS